MIRIMKNNLIKNLSVMLNLFQHLNENRIWTKFRLTNFLHPHKFWYWFLQLPLNLLLTFPFRHPPFDYFVPRNDRAWGKKTKKPIFSDRLFSKTRGVSLTGEANLPADRQGRRTEPEGRTRRSNKKRTPA